MIQKISDDGQIALASRTNDRAEKLRLQRILDVVRIEPVEIAFEQNVSGKCEIRVREVQNSRPRGRGRILFRLALFFGWLGRLVFVVALVGLFFFWLLLLAISFSGHGPASRCVGIEEAVRLLKRRNPLQIERRLAGIAKAGFEMDLRIG